MAQPEQVPEPSPEKGSPLEKLPTVQEMAERRFGSVDGLAVVHKTTQQLAEYYAERYGLDKSDPEVSLVSTALAFVRHKEFTLLVELERDLFQRVMTHPEGKSYGEVLFQVTQNGQHKSIHKELDRLHVRGSRFVNELLDLADEALPGDQTK